MSEKCINRESCEYYQDQIKIYKGLKSLGQDAAADYVANELRTCVCNKKLKSVFCPQNLGPTSLPHLGSCGKGFDLPSFIVNGEETPPGKYPFLALLGYESTRIQNVNRKPIKTTVNLWVCAGTLINKWYVLTAAHCLSGKNEKRISKLELGMWKVLGYGGKQPEEFPAVQYFDIDEAAITVHEDYNIVYENNKKNVVNDIGLIKLPREAELNVLVQVACLPAYPEEFNSQLNAQGDISDLVGEKASVVGWGKIDAQQDIEFGGVGSKTQQFVELPILSKEQCESKNNGFIPRQTQICAGGEGHGKDACRGDSGGGIFIQQHEGEPWYAVGIVSFGSKACGNGAAGVYTRISEFMTWIKKNLK